MNIKKEPKDVWREYERGVSYNQNINLYETVKRKSDFYNDKQWGDLNAPDIDKPVFNFLKPVVNYYIAQIISDDTIPFIMRPNLSVVKQCAIITIIEKNILQHSIDCMRV